MKKKSFCRENEDISHFPRKVHCNWVSRFVIPYGKSRIKKKIFKHNSVYDQIIGVVDYTNLFILGITCAMAWQLPHEPFDEDFLKEQLQNDDEPKRRIDGNVTDASSIDYVDRNYNSIDASSWHELFEKNNFSYSASWDDSTRFVKGIFFR